MSELPRAVLYVGEIEPGGTCRDRMLALRDLGFDVEAFDTTPFLRAGPRALRSVAHRLNLGPRVGRLNRELERLSGSGGPSRIVWIDKGKWIYPETLGYLRQKCGRPIIHFTPDAQFFDNVSRHFRRSVPLYDVLVTTKPFEIERYRNAGARRLVLTGQSYDELRADAARCRSDLASEVCFIGHRQPHYERILGCLSRRAEGFHLRVWGPGWPGRRLDYVVGPGLWEADYYDGLRSARIGLGLLSKRVPETSTTRTFEIPASGTLLLAERTEEHLRFFEEGVEAEFFTDLEEMIQKIRFYLRNDVARVRVSEAGRRKCEQGGYGNRARMRALVRAIERDHKFNDIRFGARA